MTTPADQTAATSELRCVGCGYLLRGLGRTGRCPECGLPIARSTEWDQAARQLRRRPPKRLLQLAEPRWVRGLAIGTVLLVVAQVIVGIWIVMVGSLPWNLMAPDYVLLVGAIVYAAATVFLAWPEPRVLDHLPPEMGWQVLRGLLAVGGAAAVVAASLKVISELVPWSSYEPYHRVSAALAQWVVAPLLFLTCLTLATASERLAEMWMARAFVAGALIVPGIVLISPPNVEPLVLGVSYALFLCLLARAARLIWKAASRDPRPGAVEC